MKQYSILKAIPLSFFSRTLYQDVGQNWRGLGFIYLLILAALTWLPYAYLWNQAVVYFTETTAPAIITQLPTIHIENGRLTTDKAKPYLIQDPKSGKIVGIIDTTGSYTSLNNTSASFLLTSDKLLYLAEPNKVTIHAIKEIKETYHIDQTKLNEQLQLVKRYFPLACFILGTFGFLILRITQTICCSVAGLIIANTNKLALSYKTIIRLSAVAITPVVLFTTVLDLWHLHFAYQGLVKTIIALGYVYFAIKANATKTEGA